MSKLKNLNKKKEYQKKKGKTMNHRYNLFQLSRDKMI